MNKEPYFVASAQEFGESVKEYLNKTKYNYVIVEGVTPIMWDGGEYPIIFGSITEVGNELSNWETPIHNISIITEEDYIKTYLGNAWDEWYEDPNDTIMDEWGNTHDIGLVRQINDAWKKNREMFHGILCALYKRDIDEITDADSFQIDMWRPDIAGDCRQEIVDAWNKGMKDADWTRYNELVLEDMVREWDLFANNYLMHIADDTDLQCILNYLHYPHLPIYKK